MRSNLQLIVFCLAFLSLGACGFKPALTWNQLDGPVEVVSVEPYSSVQRQLQQLINISLAEQESTSSTEMRRIELQPLETLTKVLSVDSNGRPAEYRVEIQQEAEFYVGDTSYNESFSQRRDYVFDVRDILAYQRQLEQLKKEMHDRLAQQILYAYAARLKTTTE